MISGIKKILGIEGVKIALAVAEAHDCNKSRELEGEIIASTKRDALIENLEVKVVERYQRGRKKSKLIDEYTIGHVKIDGPISLLKEEQIVIPFRLTLHPRLSQMEQFGKSNFVFGGIAGLANLLKGVKSTWKVKAEARVEGTKLHPIAEKEIVVKY